MCSKHVCKPQELPVTRKHSGVSKPGKPRTKSTICFYRPMLSVLSHLHVCVPLDATKADADHACTNVECPNDISGTTAR